MASRASLAAAATAVSPQSMTPCLRPAWKQPLRSTPAVTQQNVGSRLQEHCPASLRRQLLGPASESLLPMPQESAAASSPCMEPTSAATSHIQVVAGCAYWRSGKRGHRASAAESYVRLPKAVGCYFPKAASQAAWLSERCTCLGAPVPCRTAQALSCILRAITGPREGNVEEQRVQRFLASVWGHDCRHHQHLSRSPSPSQAKLRPWLLRTAAGPSATAVRPPRMTATGCGGCGFLDVASWDVASLAAPLVRDGWKERGRANTAGFTSSRLSRETCQADMMKHSVGRLGEVAATGGSGVASTTGSGVTPSSGAVAELLDSGGQSWSENGGAGNGECGPVDEGDESGRGQSGPGERGEAQQCHSSLVAASTWQAVGEEDVATGGHPSGGRSDGETGHAGVPGDGYFPYSGVFEVAGSQVSAADVRELVLPLLLEKRAHRMMQVVAGRTFTLVPVIEGLHDLGNVAAVCRTAEALGLQSLHVIQTGTERYKSNPRVSAGADKWLDVERWSGTAACLTALQQRGYRIAVTFCGKDTVPITDMDWTIPTAVVLGNEHQGVSEAALAAADITCSIPMGGFTDSFNVSVAAAIVLYHATRDRIARQGFHADLTAVQRDILLADFLLRHRKDTESITKELLRKQLERAEREEARDCGGLVARGGLERQSRL